MLGELGTNSTVHRAFLEDPFRSWVTDSSSSSARRYLPWWPRRRTALALWNRSIPVCTKKPAENVAREWKIGQFWV